MAKMTKIIVVIFLCWAASCSSIKIESGTTVEEMAAKNEFRSKEIRGNWAEQLARAENDGVRAIMVKAHIDSVSSMIRGYGYKVADEWRRGSAGRGEIIKDSEMRQVVDAWVAAQKPILQAYEDNMEYGINLLREKRNFGLLTDEVGALFDSLALNYYDTYSTVFYPNRSVEDYENGLLKSGDRHRLLSDKLGTLIKGY
jgi:hypothetical protein